MNAADHNLNLEQAAQRIARSRYVVALVGAGLSVESGVPTFRGPGGLWTKLGEPTMNGYEDFLRDPAAWWNEQQSQPRSNRTSQAKPWSLRIGRPRKNGNLEDDHYSEC